MPCIQIDYELLFSPFKSDSLFAFGRITLEKIYYDSFLKLFFLMKLLRISIASLLQHRFSKNGRSSETKVPWKSQSHPSNTSKEFSKVV